MIHHIKTIILLYIAKVFYAMFVYIQKRVRKQCEIEKGRT